MLSGSVLVLDGNTRAALATVRSLGRAGLHVIVGSETPRSLAGSSKFCKRIVLYSPPDKDAFQFAKNISDLVIQWRPDILIPITDASVYALLQHRELFDDLVALPFVSFKSYRAASDKCLLVKLARKLDIPCPESLFIDFPTSSSLESQLSGLRYPVILKPASSIVSAPPGLLKTGVRFANNESELLKIVAEDESFGFPFMLQELIRGEGVGIFALCEQGEIIAVFSHKRIREKPPWGGVSVVCESTQPDPEALASAQKLLRQLNWNGVAMVEFKRDHHRGTPILMEINARFWGSLQLAIDAGVDFPQLLCRMALNAGITSRSDYMPTRSRWLLGDVDNLIISLKASKHDKRYPLRIQDKLSVVYTFFREFFKGSYIEECRYGDNRPFLFSLQTWLKTLK